MAEEKVYDNLPSPLPPSLPSQSFQAARLAEFGTRVTLGASNRLLTSFTVCFATWGYQSKYPSAPDPWTADITLNLYQVDPNDETRTGPRFFQMTRNFQVPWRPEPDAACGDTRWQAPDGCHNGFAFTLTFDGLDTANITLPDELIYGIAYNTQDGGYQPVGSEGPINDLNMGMPSTAPTTGNNPLTYQNFLYSTEKSSYADNGKAGTSVFRLDTGGSDPGASYPTISVGITAKEVPVTQPVPPSDTLPMQPIEDIWHSIEEWMGTEYVNCTFAVAFDGTGTSYSVTATDAIGNRMSHQDYKVGTRIQVNPSGTTVNAGATQQFSAVAYAPSGPGVPIPSIANPYIWTMESGSLGTVDQNGLYTAPASVQHTNIDRIRCQLVGQQVWTIVQINLQP